MVLRWVHAHGRCPCRDERRQFQEDGGRKAVPDTSHPLTEREGHRAPTSLEEKTPAEPVVERPSARQRSSLFVTDPTR
jgi:hypothetical protein